MRTDWKIFKMPTFEIAIFSGYVNDWLKFWNQFRKIDEDNEVDDEDKYQMLLRSERTIEKLLKIWKTGLAKASSK